MQGEVGHLFLAHGRDPHVDFIPATGARLPPDGNVRRGTGDVIDKQARIIDTFADVPPADNQRLYPGHSLRYPQ